MFDSSLFDFQSIAGLISGIIGLIAFIPYILETLNHQTKPSKASWVIWAALGIIIATSYYASGARETLWLAIAYAIGDSVIAVLSLRYGTEGWSKLDFFCLAGAALGIIMWFTTGVPMFALYLTVAVYGIGSLPTIKKAFDHPKSESKFAWALFLVADSLNFLAIGEGNWSLEIVSYPICALAITLAVVGLICWPRKTKSRKN